MRCDFSCDLVRTLRLRRQSRNITQKQLGDLLGMAQSQIARIERGRSDMRVSTLIDLARSLGLEPMLVPKHLLPAIGYLIEEKSSTARAKAPKLVGNEPEDMENEEGG
jgi:transcriptional regulator with XRE-family HTH domain